jgi:SAM-dependent methyltransferase
MTEAGEVPAGAEADVKEGDALALPFADGEFDRVVAAEILEHVPADIAAIEELVRVTRPGGTVALTVPRWLPEAISWKLSDEYHDVPGGHIRIYTDKELASKAENAGLVLEGRDHVHGLHSPYWWLKCAVGVTNDRHPLVRAYHRLLVWEIMEQPAVLRAAGRVLDPLIGKSLVLYFRKPVDVG